MCLPCVHGVVQRAKGPKRVFGHPVQECPQQYDSILDTSGAAMVELATLGVSLCDMDLHIVGRVSSTLCLPALCFHPPEPCRQLQMLENELCGKQTRLSVGTLLSTPVSLKPHVRLWCVW